MKTKEKRVLGYLYENVAFTREEILDARNMINTRVYEGQNLGIEYPDGSVVPLEEELVQKVLKLDNEGFYKILDFTPLGRLPIVVL